MDRCSRRGRSNNKGTNMDMGSTGKRMVDGQPEESTALQDFGRHLKTEEAGAQQSLRPAGPAHP